MSSFGGISTSSSITSRIPSQGLGLNRKSDSVSEAYSVILCSFMLIFTWTMEGMKSHSASFVKLELSRKAADTSQVIRHGAKKAFWVLARRLLFDFTYRLYYKLSHPTVAVCLNHWKASSPNPQSCYDLFSPSLIFSLDAFHPHVRRSHPYILTLHCIFLSTCLKAPLPAAIDSWETITFICIDTVAYHLKWKDKQLMSQLLEVGWPFWDAIKTCLGEGYLK